MVIARFKLCNDRCWVVETVGGVSVRRLLLQLVDRGRVVVLPRGVDVRRVGHVMGQSRFRSCSSSTGVSAHHGYDELMRPLFRAVYTGTRPGLTPAIRAGKGWRGRRELAPRCSATQLGACSCVHIARDMCAIQSSVPQPPPPPPPQPPQVATSVQTVLCCTLSDNGDSWC